MPCGKHAVNQSLVNISDESIYLFAMPFMQIANIKAKTFFRLSFISDDLQMLAKLLQNKELFSNDK